ncbi:hypothetical protein OBBRIDRAFT_438805 [Obba rivulosa]|uniref:Uncharacterized protein n=1 Tax=Obba rivulosa TaxID=1052685 RepID=A0A8E2DFR9_9APHY|nr:hypothetical protein OBBRIDRAFT_438805 [Obba rivulosa]
MPYVAIIFVEDSLSSMEVWKKRGNDIRRNLDAMMSAIAKRRDTWANRQEAYDYFSSRAPWKTWDKRVLDLYVRHGLKDTLPSESDKSTVTLACDKSQEKATYADHDNEPYRGAARYLESLDPDFDIHCVYGEKEDFIRQASHDSILASRRMASVYRVPNAAHFVIQQNPQGVALCLGQILRDIVEGPLRPRL